MASFGEWPATGGWGCCCCHDQPSQQLVPEPLPPADAFPHAPLRCFWPREPERRASFALCKYELISRGATRLPPTSCQMFQLCLSILKKGK
jgi:hypothetical protein